MFCALASKEAHTSPPLAQAPLRREVLGDAISNRKKAAGPRSS